MMAPGWNVHLTKKAQEFYPAVCHFALNEPVCIPWRLDFMFREYENKKTWRIKEGEKSWKVWAYFSVLHFMNIVMMYKSVSN